MTARLLDTETTGTEEGDEIIEMAFLDLDSSNCLATGYSNSARFRPTKTIQLGALNVHHILPSDLAGCALPSSAAIIPPDTTYLVGHNIDFDWKMLGKPPVKRICTLALCRSIWPDCDSHSLGAMLYYLEGQNETTREKLRNAHCAADDITNNYTVLLHITKALKITDTPSLYIASENARIPVKMTFGKHKGKLISEVDKGYASWYSKQPDIDEYLMTAFRMHKLLPPKRN